MDIYRILDDKGSIALDSNIMIKDEICSAGSKMLEAYKAAFSSTLVSRLENDGYGLYCQGAVSEFALGQGEFGSLVALGDDNVSIAIGTDTGGNFANDLADKGLTGFIPTKGTVSAYGLISASSSFTRIALGGSFGDIRGVLNIIGGYDEKDPMSIRTDMDLKAEDLDFENYSFGIYGKIGPEAGAFADAAKEISFIKQKWIDSVFDIIRSVEVAGSTAKYDGIRYGYIAEDFDNIDELYEKTRGQGFSLETKKAIIKGNLYAGNFYERKSYENALRMRRVLVEEVEKALDEFDFILGHVDSNLAKLAGLASLPLAVLGDMLIVAKRYEDEKLLNMAEKIGEVL